MKFVEKLKQAVGSITYNTEGETIGRIAEVTRNVKEELQYIIIGSDNFGGNRSRYFAIPATKAFVEIKENGKAILLVAKDDLRVAKRIYFDQCPAITENNFLHSIYEISDYCLPTDTNRKIADSVYRII